MARFAPFVALLLLLIAPALAEPPPTVAPGAAQSVQLQPVAIYGADGRVVSFPDPNRTMVMPFVRATGSGFMFPATSSPQQFLVTQPAGTTTYRAYNPCAAADVRITSVSALEPLVAVATEYPGVARVTSRTGTIDRFSGTRFGRGAETLGSAANPMGGPNRIVSIMIVPIPGYPADLSGMTCEFELMYGSGG
ncbi:hypothetical protein NS228_18575 [Methylobacterium indicum]|uniref:hypothetical protein n=1 Tax=Methylobacterium indicum TaxID=1775910 RepID=UPI0007348DB2|nr:hypothetical protein [Methylobacterium indicum]KTS37702.1 hypothetical protein NS228_18575 [Methylobacterium indicum]KTS39105.1 hypothetical protein NS229_01410 [Methylobacterium indicum]KTS51746.1 hypothetical protein NS230_13425 [Methylobacterium indicum]